jgi:hypothetical protein
MSEQNFKVKKGVETPKLKLLPMSQTGYPTTDTWEKGDSVKDTNGIEWHCVVAGTPGTWVDGTTGWTESNILYIGKHGNDSNDGSREPKAFLTFGAAIAAAIAKGITSTNRFTFACFDAGSYSENIAVPEYTNVFAPGAVLIGNHTMQGVCILNAGKISTSSGTAVTKNGANRGTLITSNLTTTGTAVGLSFGSSATLDVDIKRILVDSGTGIVIPSTASVDGYCGTGIISSNSSRGTMLKVTGNCNLVFTRIYEDTANEGQFMITYNGSNTVLTVFEVSTHHGLEAQSGSLVDLILNKDNTGNTAISSSATVNWLSTRDGIRWTGSGNVPTVRWSAGTGYLAIGHDNAASKIHVHDVASAGVETRYSNLTTGRTATDGVIVGMDADEKAKFWNYENTDMIFGTNNLQRFKIEANGTLSSDTANYESLVTADNDIPNKKYIDGLIQTVFATVAAAEAATSSNNFTCYIQEKEAFYRCDTSCSITRDGDLILNTAAGGTTRWKLIQKVSRSMGETGWLNTDSASISAFSSTVARLTLASTGVIAVRSLRFELAAGNYDITITGAAGAKYIYFQDGTGTLYSRDTLWDFNTQVPVMIVYWDGSIIRAAPQTEFHGIRESAWHRWAHLNIGAIYRSGMTFTGSVQPDNNVDPGVDTCQYLWTTDGVTYDEDCLITPGIGTWAQTLGSGLTSGTAALFKFLYFNGSSVVDVASMGDRTPFIHAGGNTAPQWNSGGTLVAAVTGDYVVYHFFTAPMVGGWSIFARPHNAVYTSLGNAQGANPSQLTWTDQSEVKHLYTAVFRVNTGWAPSPAHGCKLVALNDFRTVQGSPVAGVPATSHNALSDRSAVASHPAAAIYGSIDGGIQFHNAETTGFLSDSNFIWDNTAKTLKVGATSAMLKRVSGVLTDATAGTDYIVGGSGANTQIAYFTGIGVLAGSSSFTYDAANSRVGIGATPTTKLHIHGSGSSGSIASMRLSIQGQSTNGFQFGYTSYNTNDVEMWLYEAGYWRVATNNIERVRVTSDGNIGMGSTSITEAAFKISKNFTGGAIQNGIYQNGTIQSDVTNTFSVFKSTPSTAAATFALTGLYHFAAGQGTIGANSSVTQQCGFIAGSSLTGATTNYGFYGDISAAANCWNLYMGATASNFMQGSLGIGTTSLTDHKLKIGGNSTGGTTTYGVSSGMAIQSDVTTRHICFTSAPTTQATSFVLTALVHYQAVQGTIGSGSSITSQYGFYAPSSLTGATNNFGFVGDIAAATDRYNIYMGGTAQNYIAGNTGIGSLPTTTAKLRVTNSSSTTGTTIFGIYEQTIVPANVVNSYYAHITNIGTAAAAFGLANLFHYMASQAAIGGGSSVTNQYGLYIESTLTGATNNYGVHSNIATAANRWNIYVAGTAPNYFAGNVTIDGTTTIASGITGLLKATAGVISSATAGTDYIAGGSGANTQVAYFTAAGTLAGSSNFIYATSSLNLDGAAAHALTLKLSTVAKGDFAVASGVNEYCTGTVAGDIVLRMNSQKLFMSVDNGTSAQMVVTSAGIGIGGTATPTAKIDASATYNNVSGYQAAYSYITYFGATTADQANTEDGNAFVTYATSTAGAPYYYHTLVRGLVASAYSASKGSVATLYPLEVTGGVLNDGSITTMNCINVGTYGNGASGTMASIRGIRIANLSTYNVAASSVIAGILIDANNTASGTSKYGIYINNQSGASTNNFAIYVAGSAPSCFMGNISIGTNTVGSTKLRIAGNLAGASSVAALYVSPTVQSDITSNFYANLTELNTAAASFVLGSACHYYASQGTIGSGSSITNQMAFCVPSTMTGATNNYAFYSGLAASANCWNLFMAGTASNYMAGRLGLGSNSLSITCLRVANNITGGTAAYGILQDGIIQSDVTSSASGIRSMTSTAEASFVLSNSYNFHAVQGTIGSGSSITNQYGFCVGSSLSGATNNYGFYGDIAAATGRWNLFMNGTAQNFIAGKLGIGTSMSVPTAQLQIAGSSAGAVGTASLKIMNGTILGTSEYGTMEHDGTNLWFTTGTTGAGTRYQLTPSGAKRTIYLTAGGAILNTTTGGTYLQREIGTNRPNIPVVEFADGAKSYCEWSIMLPDSYDGGTITAQIQATYEADATVVDACETNAWTAGTNVTATLDAAVYKVGAQSVKLAVAAGAGAGQILGYRNFTALNMNYSKRIQFWCRSTVTLTAGQMQIRISETNALGGSPIAYNIPAVTANTWTFIDLDATSPTSGTWNDTTATDAILSTGIYQVSDIGAFDMYVDSIRFIRGMQFGVQARCYDDDGLMTATDDRSVDYAFGTAQEVLINQPYLNTQIKKGTIASAITIGGTPAGSKVLQIRAYRDTTNANDVLTGKAQLLGIKLEYGINSWSD